MSVEFKAFPKIPRLKRGIVITEKIDGTNAQVHISEDGTVLAGSRNRWITPDKDNYGFAAWVRDNAEDLSKLGPGSHFGEWWGLGIQRGYGLTEKRFSLFNTGRWLTNEDRPKCCHVVPLIGVMDFDTFKIQKAISDLEETGSLASPGFMKPEGIVIFVSASGSLFKQTIEKDDEPKSRTT